MLMFELPILVGIAGTFFIAGTVKGVIGLGLPSISLAFLTVLIDLPSAMALLLVPSFVTNLWQAFEGGAALLGNDLNILEQTKIGSYNPSQLYRLFFLSFYH